MSVWGQTCKVTVSLQRENLLYNWGVEGRKDQLVNWFPVKVQMQIDRRVMTENRFQGEGKGGEERYVVEWMRGGEMWLRSWGKRGATCTGQLVTSNQPGQESNATSRFNTVSTEFWLRIDFKVNGEGDLREDDKQIWWEGYDEGSNWGGGGEDSTVWGKTCKMKVIEGVGKGKKLCLGHTSEVKKWWETVHLFWTVMIVPGMLSYEYIW